MNFFRSRPRSPTDIVKSVRDALKSGRKVPADDIARNLTQMKTILCSDPVAEQIAHLSQEVYANDLLYLLVDNLPRLEFETRKVVGDIFNHLIRRQLGARLPTVEHITTNNEVIFSALKGYENPDISLNTGPILRDMIRYEPLAKILLDSPRLYDFFDYMQHRHFGLACDAQLTFKDLLTKHKPMVAVFLETNYDKFFTAYTELTTSQNYVAKLQSLKLLSEILIDRVNFNVMTRYIASEDNLKMIMNMLLDKSKNIPLEAFHVFKIFVANPNKPPQIVTILTRNKDRLHKFLANFKKDNKDDQFRDEKNFLMAQISQL